MQSRNQVSEKGAIKMQQVCYLLETGLLRSKQECNVCIFIHTLYLLHRWLTSHSDLNNVLASTCNNDPIICCIVNTHNLGFWLHSPAPTKTIGPNENLQSTVLTIISKFVLNLRRWRKVLSDMLHKVKDFERLSHNSKTKHTAHSSELCYFFLKKILFFKKLIKPAKAFSLFPQSVLCNLV